MANSRRWTFRSLNMGSCYPGQLRTEVLNQSHHSMTQLHLPGLKFMNLTGGHVSVSGQGCSKALYNLQFAPRCITNTTHYETCVFRPSGGTRWFSPIRSLDASWHGQTVFQCVTLHRNAVTRFICRRLEQLEAQIMVCLRLTDSCNLQSQDSEFQPWTKCHTNKLLPCSIGLCCSRHQTH